MSVLAARRQEQGGKLHQLRSECDRNCTSNFTTRATAGCISQCVQLYRDETGSSSVASSVSTSSIPSGGTRSRSPHRYYDPIRSRSRVPLIASSKDPNEIQHLDELLETEESQSSGLYVSHPHERYATDAAADTLTKDIANNTSLGSINYRSNVIENELRQTSTEKVYLKYAVTRTGPKTVPKLITSPAETSVEDADLSTYHQFGQKLKFTTPRREQTSQTVGPRKTPLQAMLINSRSSPSKTEEEVSVDTSNFKQPSKIRRINPDGQRRNIVTLTRKFGGTIPKSALETLVALSSKSSEVSAELLTVAKRNHELTKETKSTPSTPHEEIISPENSSIVNVLDTINKVGNMAALTEDGTVPEEPVSSTELFINVPDPDPIPVTENILTPSSTIEAVTPEPTTLSELILTSPSSTTTSIPTTTPKPLTTLRPTKTSTTTTTTSTTKISTTSTTTPAPPTTPPAPTTTSSPTTKATHKPTYPPLPTPPPHYRHMEETPNLIIFKPVLPPKELIANSTDQPDSLSTTPRTFTRTTVSSSVRSTINSRHRPSSTTEASTNPTTPTFDLKILSNITSYIAKGNFSDEDFQTLAKYFPDMSTRRPAASNGEVLRDDSDVTIEMHRMNMATYVLAGLGVFPIVAILLYLAKTVVFRKPPKTDADLERYMSEDLKKISPVVKIENSSAKTHQPQEGIYSEGSIMTEESFNRNLLKFKSLLGEGNFGQVWKAEADDLLGHMGTTRIVAVKTERCGMVNGGLQDEAAIMRKLGSHANVVTLLGACTTKGKLIITF